MKTKIIPFDLEMAKKIQAGEVEGRIVTRDNRSVYLVDTYTNACYLTITNLQGKVEIKYGHSSMLQYLKGSNELHIELIEETPVLVKQESALFDETYYNTNKSGIEPIYLKMAEEYTNLLCNAAGWKGADAQEVLALWIKENMPKSMCKEETSKHKFKPFDKVLVRHLDTDVWIPAIYEGKLAESYWCNDGYEYDQCIPYEGNEHLVSTTNKP